MYSSLIPIALTLALLLSSKSHCNALIVNHKFDAGVKEYSYQTFSGVAMFSVADAPAKSFPGNGVSRISFDLQVTRSFSEEPASIELVVIPDINIDDIGIKKDDQLHLCCIQELIDANLCSDIGKLVIDKDIAGIHRQDIRFEDSQSFAHIKIAFPVDVTAIHVFAMASCDENLGEVTFEGQSIWMNPYGHLPGDVYGYLPFFGWMCLAYLVISIVWFGLNALYYTQLLHVQNCITGVLAMCLIEMATWYFHYLHLNQKGVIHHGPFILGLVTTVTRRMVARMLVVAVSLGYGVVKRTLGSVRNKIIVLGVVYWIFAFLFEALIHFNQTEKVETWMRSVLIPPVAIVNGIFWWWTFVALNRTIEQLKIRRQSTKLALYKSFTLVLVIALLAAIVFAIYEMYYILKELYFAEWQRLWFMEVGFWQILFSAIFVTIMVLWRPNSVKYVDKKELPTSDTGDDEEDELGGGPDTMDDYGRAQGDSDSDDESDSDGDGTGERSGNNITKKRKKKKTEKSATTGASATANPRFMIMGDDDEDEEDTESKPKTTLTSTLINMTDELDQDTKLAAQKMD